MEHILNEIRAERVRQDAKFGEQNHQPIEFMAILAEEIGEANKEIVDAHFGFKPKDKCLEQARVELIQVAAMTFQCAEAISRHQKLPSCPFHWRETFSELQTEVEQALSFPVDGDTLRLIMMLSAIGEAYGTACKTSLEIMESGYSTDRLGNYMGDMYMTLLMAVCCVHHIDTIQKQS